MSARAEQMPRLEKYELLEEVGHGGMATVYRARDRRLGRDVAVKVIHRHLRESQEVATRFTSEARAVAKLRHPNIVEVYDVSDDGDDERYLVVELVRGTTLRKLVQQNGYMPAEIAAAVGLEVAAALEHAHEQGVIHRDVKPENVLVELPGPNSTRQASDVAKDRRPARIKITDFGIAKLLDAQGVTSTGQVLGSPAHMAPEQIEGGDVTVRADVFGMGVLLYECMVGSLPFEGKNPAQVLRRVLDGTYMPAERARHSVGSTWSAIVDKALAHEADARWSSAAELADALRRELSKLGFDDPRRELSDYLDDPDSYVASYEPRVVGKLVERGKLARAARDSVIAASCFNRALAFRPDDPELLREVAGLARMAKLKRVAARSGGVFGVALLFAGLAYGVTRSLRHAPTSPPGGARGASGSERSPGRPEGSAREPIAPVASGGPVPIATAREQHLPRLPNRGVAPAVLKKGLVRVVIKGAGGGKVSVDNGPAESPFTKQYELTVGEHRFDFIAPNTDCCEAPKPVFYTVADAPGLQIVSYEIKFLPATIQLSGPAGTELSCTALFAGRLAAPGTRQVPLNNGPSLEDSCTLFPPPGSGAPPKPIDVRLRPGRTFPISWP